MLRAAVWMGVALGLLGSGASAAENSGARSEWLSRPTGEDFARELAGKPGASLSFSRVVMSCHLEDDGALSACKIVRETPAGAGLGDAMLALAPKYRHRPPGSRDPRQIGIVEGDAPVDAPTDWKRKPTADNLRAVFPTEAYRRGIDGRAVVNCIVTIQGNLNDCVAISEYPEGAAFGAAAVALTPQFLMRPAQYKGQPVQTVVSIPINFEMEGMGMGGTGGGDMLGAKSVLPPTIAWATAPSFDDVASAYPEKARAEKLAGRVTLVCDMTEEGRLKDCDASAAEPRGRGFEAAAKALSKQFMYPIVSDNDRKATHRISVHLVVAFDPAALTPGGGQAVGKPVWAHLPTPEQMQVVAGQVKGTDVARAQLSCRVQPGGTLSDCSVLSETPSGTGAGAAALSLVPGFRVSTWSAEGLPVVGGRLVLPLKFEPPPAPPPAAPAAK